MKIFLFGLVLILSFSSAKTQVKEHFGHTSASLNFVTSDIYNFYEMLDYLREAYDKQDTLTIIKKSYIDKSSLGLREYWITEKANGRNAIDDYYNIIRSYPKYFESQKAMMFKVAENIGQIDKYLNIIKGIYPEANFYDNYLSIGIFNTQGQMMKSRSIYIGLESILKSIDTDYSEFSDDFFWLQEDGGSLEELCYLLVHENLHTQQQSKDSQRSLLNSVIIEGAAVFLTEFICGESSLISAAGLSKQMIESAKQEGVNIWSDFAKDISNNDFSQWFFNDNGKYPFAMGYYMGYAICKDFYDSADDKSKAISILVEVKDPDYIYKNSSYHKFNTKE